MKTVTIIGGGLSGLCLGIGLRQRGVPVRIIEAGSYPRHKVCGEFLSGKGRGVLASLGLAPRSALASDDMSIGDALTMIPPVTGNGMSMACESAAAAVEPLVAWSDGASSWDKTRLSLAGSLHSQFSIRLRTPAVLQRMAVHPSARRVLFESVKRMPKLQSLLFRMTG